MRRWLRSSLCSCLFARLLPGRRHVSGSSAYDARTQRMRTSHDHVRSSTSTVCGTTMCPSTSARLHARRPMCSPCRATTPSMRTNVRQLVGHCQPATTACSTMPRPVPSSTRMLRYGTATSTGVPTTNDNVRPARSAVCGAPMCATHARLHAPSNVRATTTTHPKRAGATTVPAWVP